MRWNKRKQKQSDLFDNRTRRCQTKTIRSVEGAVNSSVRTLADLDDQRFVGTDRAFLRHDRIAWSTLTSRVFSIHSILSCDSIDAGCERRKPSNIRNNDGERSRNDQPWLLPLALTFSGWIENLCRSCGTSARTGRNDWKSSETSGTCGRNLPSSKWLRRCAHTGSNLWGNSMILQRIPYWSFESLSQELNNRLESIRGKLDTLLSTGDQRRRSSITEIQHRLASISQQVRSTRVVNHDN